ncbi:hypothetical protein D9619_004850 [Psilocybe cf. subviscida]|uniref:F-box domain-containing protein n=1 Tax=Psilocybe cf. subviscida TaxID=2480587 RepID=A0A8H5BR93_9AGAR|nr:hypothetical protein D9619_004850 [Psilocybe cf. subviscida]
MKSRRRSRPPPSSSHAPSETPPVPINIDELSSRLGLPEIPRSTESHISLLPPEILAQIFTYCIPQERFPHISNTAAPVLLTHVSPYWRALALSLPELWSSVHIAYRNVVEDIPAIESLLARSGDRPLALSIAIDFAEQPQEEILAVLQGHSKRWKNVRFDFGHLLCPPVYSLDQALGNVPQLETFEFHAKDISDVNITPVTQLLRSAPRLRELSWFDDLADVDTLLQLPLSRLTHLSLSIEHDTLDYMQVLKECSNLEHIRLTRPRPRSPSVQPQAPLFLAKLTSLNISSDMLGILDNLILPALKEVRIYGDRRPSLPRPAGHTAAVLHPGASLPPYLSYTSPSLPHIPHSSTEGDDSREGFDATALLSLFDRSLCAITSLSVKAPMAEDMLIRCLRATSSSLVRLSLDGVHVGDGLLQALTWRHNPTRAHVGQISLHYGTLSAPANRKGEGGSGVQVVGHDSDLEEGRLCPKLEELEFDRRVVCSHGVLASMIESRVIWSSPSGTWAPYSPANAMWLAGGIDDGGLSAMLAPLRKVKVVDGHRDLERLKELSLLSRRHSKALAPAGSRVRVPMRRSWTEGNFRQAIALQTRAPLTLVVVPIPKTANTRPSGFTFRRKLCASR